MQITHEEKAILVTALMEKKREYEKIKKDFISELSMYWNRQIEIVDSLLEKAFERTSPCPKNIWIGTTAHGRENK